MAEASDVVLAEVTDHPLDVPTHESAVASAHAGAVVSFAGIVRDHDGGRSVARLDYEAHPSAADVLREVAEQIGREHPGIRIAVSHRHGSLAIGDAALVAAVAAAHRREAFDACAALVDAVKERIPVWKHQVFSDGTDEWVNSA